MNKKEKTGKIRKNKKKKEKRKYLIKTMLRFAGSVHCLKENQ